MLKEIKAYFLYTKFRDALKKSMEVNTMVNWKTTLGAFVTLLAGILPLLGLQITGEVQAALITVGVFIIGIFAKDSNVTGGTKQQ